MQTLPSIKNDVARSASALAPSESNYSSAHHGRFNRSIDISSRTGKVMRKSGQVMAGIAGISGRAHSTLEPVKGAQSALQIQSYTLNDNPYGGVSISDMFKREARA